MMTKSNTTQDLVKAYETPTIEVTVVSVEQGFAVTISIEDLGGRLPDQPW